MAAQQLVNILERTATGSQVDLDNARNFLERAAIENLPELLKQLSDILIVTTNSSTARAQAALQLKNALYSRDDSRAFQERWLRISEDIRNHIKINCFNALGTETSKPSQAAQCVGYIACAELPSGQWSNLIERLVANVTGSDKSDSVREASLEALGYICQDIEPNILGRQSNLILTALVHAMRAEEKDNVRLAATTALYNSLEFTKSNFLNENERDYIMQVVCGATLSENVKIKVAALQNLVKILTLYYDYMESYMVTALFGITMDAMKSSNDEIALQGIEFWSNVCDEEYDLQLLEQSQDENPPSARKSRSYARGALAYLIPVLLQRLTMQEETDDDDDWNPCKAAGVCLMLLANCTGNMIIGYIFPFVNENIKHQNWRHREAAVMAFGSMLEGPDETTIQPIATQSIPFLLDLLNDQFIPVRDTTAWTIGRIFEFVPQAAINPQIVPIVYKSLIVRLADDPRVATNICWSFSSLIRAAYDNAECAEDDETPRTYLLSPYFDEIATKLIETTDRNDGNRSNLRNAAYEALMEMIRHSPKDCYAAVQTMTMVVLERLNRVISAENHVSNPNDRVQISDLQSLLCATLQSVLRKIDPKDIPLISDRIMRALLQMISTNVGKASAVQEDALITLGTLIEVLGPNFHQYLEHVLPPLYESLNNHAEYQICGAAVAVVSDLSRSLVDKLIPHCDQIMTCLFRCLGDDRLDRSVKPQILSTFGEIALAIGGHFKIYLEHVLNTLSQACRAQISSNNYDVIDYLNELREACLSAYAGIIQGLKMSANASSADPKTILNELTLVTNQLPVIIEFLEIVAREPNKPDSMVSAAIGLIGDLVTSYGQQILQYIERNPIDKLIMEGERSKTRQTKKVAKWVQREIGNAKKN